MRDKLFILFIFIKTATYSQAIEPLKTSDSAFISSLEKISLLFEESKGAGPDNSLYFTSVEEFKSYKRKFNDGIQSLYYPSLKNFDFSKYNMLLLNYEYHAPSFNAVELKFGLKDGKYLIIIDQKMNSSVLLVNRSAGIRKLIMIPKEKSTLKPEILIYNHY